MDFACLLIQYSFILKFRLHIIKQFQVAYIILLDLMFDVRVHISAVICAAADRDSVIIKVIMGKKKFSELVKSE